jgi:hypothetical protein
VTNAGQILAQQYGGGDFTGSSRATYDTKSGKWVGPGIVNGNVVGFSSGGVIGYADGGVVANLARKYGVDLSQGGLVTMDHVPGYCGVGTPMANGGVAALAQKYGIKGFDDGGMVDYPTDQTDMYGQPVNASFGAPVNPSPDAPTDMTSDYVGPNVSNTDTDAMSLSAPVASTPMTPPPSSGFPDSASMGVPSPTPPPSPAPAPVDPLRTLKARLGVQDKPVAPPFNLYDKDGRIDPAAFLAQANDYKSGNHSNLIGRAAAMISSGNTYDQMAAKGLMQMLGAPYDFAGKQAESWKAMHPLVSSEIGPNGHVAMTRPFGTSSAATGTTGTTTGNTGTTAPTTGNMGATGAAGAGVIPPQLRDKAAMTQRMSPWASSDVGDDLVQATLPHFDDPTMQSLALQSRMSSQKPLLEATMADGTGLVGDNFKNREVARQEASEAASTIPLHLQGIKLVDGILSSDKGRLALAGVAPDFASKLSQAMGTDIFSLSDADRVKAVLAGLARNNTGMSVRSQNEWNTVVQGATGAGGTPESIKDALGRSLMNNAVTAAIPSLYDHANGVRRQIVNSKGGLAHTGISDINYTGYSTAARQNMLRNGGIPTQGQILSDLTSNPQFGLQGDPNAAAKTQAAADQQANAAIRGWFETQNPVFLTHAIRYGGANALRHISEGR